MYYPLLHCKDCVAGLDNLNMAEMTIGNILIEEEKGRNIYFAPVGNQFNFGVFANGRTPRVIVMGITTSPSARDNFIGEFNRLRRIGYSGFESLSAGCIKNIFNSDNGKLLTVLSWILNNTGIIEYVGCAGKVEINREFLRGNNNSENYERLVNNIYFTQMIMCASCMGENGARAPARLTEIGDFQNKCIRSQLDFVSSFKGQADLMISFGRINKVIIEQLDTMEVIGAKCKYHVNISHPTTGGWNGIGLMHHSRDGYIDLVEEKAGRISFARESDRAAYITSLVNCYDQFTTIKNIIDSL